MQFVDMSMNDTEIEIQNNMFERIMDICSGNPSRRVLQVLVDALMCTALVTGESLDSVIKAMQISYNDVLSKHDEN